MHNLIGLFNTWTYLVTLLITSRVQKKGSKCGSRFKLCEWAGVDLAGNADSNRIRDRVSQRHRRRRRRRWMTMIEAFLPSFLPSFLPRSSTRPNLTLQLRPMHQISSFLLLLYSKGVWRGARRCFHMFYIRGPKCNQLGKNQETQVSLLNPTDVQQM